MSQNDMEYIKAIGEAAIRYANEYDLIGEWYLNPIEKIMLSRSDGRHVCRFCDRTEEQVTFLKAAHSIPESMGNKSLFSTYECDECNEAFGNGIENDFGNWSKPMRTMLRIRGKKGVPKIVRDSKGGWRAEYVDGRLNVQSYEENPIFEIDQENKRVTFRLMRDPYVPMGVLKTFCKIALTLLPEDEVTYYKDAIAWIRSPHVESRFAQIPVLRTFVPGPLPNDKIALRLHRRKNDATLMPYIFLVFMYGNEVFQVFIPSRARDAHLEGVNASIPPYPTPYDLDPARAYGRPIRGPVNLSNPEIVRGDTVTLSMGFDAIEEREALPVRAGSQQA